MRAVTFQAPGEVRIEEKPDPEVSAADEATIAWFESEVRKRKQERDGENDEEAGP